MALQSSDLNAVSPSAGDLIVDDIKIGTQQTGIDRAEGLLEDAEPPPLLPHHGEQRPMFAGMRLDAGLRPHLVRYANSTKKELADILNTKAYFIASSALKLTQGQQDTHQAIRQELGGERSDDHQDLSLRAVRQRRGHQALHQISQPHHQLFEGRVVMAIHVLGRFTNLPRRVDEARL